ncbi:hypothetical protein J6590_053066 [Homalodisca vitripennis]|nr:hypothetical protein J6590_053066 [Homalodisca vitripennis]
MASSEIETWICSECNVCKQFCKTNIIAEENFVSDPGDSMLNTVTDTVAAPTNPNSSCTENNTSLMYLENSLRENDLTNEEDRLKMAATIGTVLLEENQFLRGQIAILENRVASSEAIMEEELKENEINTELEMLDSTQHELAQIKLRQDLMENTLKTLQAQLGSQVSKNVSGRANSTSSTPKKTLNNKSTRIVAKRSAYRMSLQAAKYRSNHPACSIAEPINGEFVQPNSTNIAIESLVSNAPQDATLWNS